MYKIRYYKPSFKLEFFYSGLYCVQDENNNEIRRCYRLQAKNQRIRLDPDPHP